MAEQEAKTGRHSNKPDWFKPMLVALALTWFNRRRTSTSW